jgi:hypothetical protein
MSSGCAATTNALAGVQYSISHSQLSPTQEPQRPPVPEYSPIREYLLVAGLFDPLSPIFPDATQSAPQTTTTPRSTIGTREEVVARLHQILQVRDQAIQTRNPLLLDGIYTIDCPCLKGDQQLIRNLRLEQRMWRGVKVSIAVREAERINDRLWTVSAVVTTSSFEITTESGVVLREIPQGRELSRFALARPMNQEEWLLGQASVIQERD